MAGEGRVRGSWAYDTYCIARPPERPLTQPSPTGWGEEQEKTPHLNLLPQDGERSKRRPLISIFSHRMGRRGRSRTRPRNHVPLYEVEGLGEVGVLKSTPL